MSRALAQEVVPLNGVRFSAELTAIDAGGRAQFGPGRSLPLGELVRWGHPVGPRPQPIVLLADGSRLVAVAAWSGGAPVTLVGEELIVTSDLLNDCRTPRRFVRGIVFAERSHPDLRRRLEEQVQMAAGAERKTDQVLLTNDDRLTGRVTEITSGTLTLSTDSGSATLPLSRIQAVTFAQPPAGEPDQAPRPATIFALRDGSLLRAQSVQASADALHMQLAAGGLTLSGGNVADVVALQSLGGPRLAYLSDLEPSGYRHVPYVSIEWPYRRDRNVRGGPLTVSGNRYLKGLGMHSAARLTYPLNAADGWRRFDANIAVDDSAGGRGSVTFGVHVLRGGQWQAAFASGIVRGGDQPVDVSVDVSGATGLTLTVDYAERGDELDHADWLDARLVK